MIFNWCIIFQPNTYYSSSKSSCGFDYKLISFETQTKLKCVEDLLKGTNLLFQTNLFHFPPVFLSQQEGFQWSILGVRRIFWLLLGQQVVQRRQRATHGGLRAVALEGGRTLECDQQGVRRRWILHEQSAAFNLFQNGMWLQIQSYSWV